jgi:phosphatidylglycerol:prolipoprotein diacylglycerol transferase
VNVDISFDPIIAQIGPFQLGWHGLFTAIAVVVAIRLAAYLGERQGVPADTIYGIATWGVIGGIVGARLFHVADHLSYYLENPLLIPQVWEGGIAIYGAFIGGLIGGGIAAWREHLPIWVLLDVAAPAMLVGQVIGRLGCLSNGDAWGAQATPCPYCLTLTYLNPNDLLPDNLRGVPTYPYPFYEQIGVLILLGVLWLARDQLARVPGLRFLVAALGYAIIRFVLTYFRQETVIVWGLQEAQVIALVTAAVIVPLLVWRARGLFSGFHGPAAQSPATAGD